MTPPAPPERLIKQVRSMALLCALFGPSLVVLAAMGGAGAHLFERLAVTVPTMGPYERISLAFGVDSLLVTIPLGATLCVAGVWALRDATRARSVLELAAWVSIAAMFAYGVVWSRVVIRMDGSAMAHLGGWLLHLLQALAVGGALRFLRRDDVRSAVAVR